MPVPTDLRTLCSALEHFHLPAALGSLRDNRLVAWNPSFREMAELSEGELVEVKLTSLIALDEITDSFEEQLLRSDPIPDSEAATLQGLMNSSTISWLSNRPDKSSSS